MKKGNAWPVGAIVVVAAAFWIVRAGSLEPPGPPAPTMKPLDQVEARFPLSNADLAIAASGSYYLVEDIESAASSGLEIAVSDVTLDLNGFSIVGTQQPGIAGISISNTSNVVIKNGSVSGFDDGLAVVGTTNLDLRELVIVGHLEDGIDSTDSDVSVLRCTIEENGANGVRVTSSGSLSVTVIEHSSIAHNIADGITADSTLLEVRDTRVLLNGGRGIAVSMADAKLFANTVDLNGGSGILAGITSGAIVDNRCFYNGAASGGYGIEVAAADPTQLVARNIAVGNATGNFLIDSAASAAPQSSLGGGPGAWDNIVPTP